MRKKRALQCFIAGVILLAGVWPAFAGDSLYGRVKEVKSADVVVLDYGAGSYVIHVIGIDVPREGRIAVEARQFVAKLVLGKHARIRLGRRLENGELVARLLTAEPDSGFRDVGLELVRAGLARRQKGEESQFDYKYGELSLAEREAQKGQRGLWATTPPQ